MEQCFYEQTCGVTMEGPLRPDVVNFVWRRHGERLLPNA